MDGPLSMSRRLWVRFVRFLECIHRKVTPERPLLAAPQDYLLSKRASTYFVGGYPYYPRPPLQLLERPLQHFRLAYPGVVAPRVAKVDESILYPCLEDRNRLGVALLVERDELLKGSGR